MKPNSKQNDKQCKQRGLVCMFCGEGFGYVGDKPDEITIKTAYEHEAKCSNNPYKAEIERLKAALIAIEKFGHSHGHGCGYTCANMAKKALLPP